MHERTPHHGSIAFLDLEDVVTVSLVTRLPLLHRQLEVDVVDERDLMINLYACMPHHTTSDQNGVKT